MGKEVTTLKLAEEKNYIFDAGIVLGASAQKNRRGEWEMPTMVGRNSRKVSCGYMRAIGAQQANSEGLARVFLVTGGNEVEGTDEISRAELMKALMTTGHQSIPEEQVHAIGKAGSVNTQGNAKDVADYLQANPGLIETKRFALLSNDFHLPRAGLMFGEIFTEHPYFKERGIIFISLSIEQLLLRRSQYYEKWIRALYNSPEMRRAITTEMQGIKALRQGAYKARHS